MVNIDTMEEKKEEEGINGEMAATCTIAVLMVKNYQQQDRCLSLPIRSFYLKGILFMEKNELFVQNFLEKNLQCIITKFDDT